jgi:flagellar protein FlbD
MIDLTRLNGTRLVLNCDLIKFAEAAPDTTLTLITGEKLIVRESLDELGVRIASFRSTVLHGAWPDAAAVLSAWHVVGSSSQRAQTSQEEYRLSPRLYR